MSHGVSRAPDAERKWPGSLSHASEGGHGDDRVAPPAAESASEDSPSLLDVNAHPPPRACWPRPKPCGGQALSRFSLISQSHRSCLLRLVRAFGVWGGSKLCRQLCSFPVTKSFGQREGVHSGARLLSPSCQPLPSPPPSSEPPPPRLPCPLQSREVQLSQAPQHLRAASPSYWGLSQTWGGNLDSGWSPVSTTSVPENAKASVGPRSAPQRAVMTTCGDTRPPRRCRFV